MTTKCYEVIFRDSGEVYNEGYIIAQIENGKLLSLEGVFTCDFLRTKISEEEIVLQYYLNAEGYELFVHDFDVSISRKDFELPLNIEDGVDVGFDGIEYHRAVSFKTQYEIEDVERIKMYQREINRYKADMYFEEG